MDDTLMQFVVIIAIIIGLPVLITIIRQRFFSNRPAEPPDEVDLLNNPISHVMPEETHGPDETTIPIYKLSNIAEAHALKALLEDHGIDCMVHSFMDYAYGGIWQAQKGWGVLKVLAKDQAKAEDLIDAFLKAKDQSPDEMMQETPIPPDKPALPGIIFFASLVILLAVGALIVVAIFSAYRDSGRELAEEGYDYSINNEYDNAIEYYSKAISHWYRESWVYNNRGYARYRKGDLDNAIKDYDKAIKINPKLYLAYINRGLAKYDKGDYPGSLMDCEQAIKINPKDALAWANKGYVLGKLGQYEESFKAFDKAITLNPKNAAIWYDRACVYSFRNDKQNVLEDLKKAVNLDAKLKTEARKDDDFKWLWEDEEFKKITEGK
jgi:tetratricopeptide (TPR) repeat protein